MGCKVMVLFGKQKVKLITIPKNTLLFRVVDDYKSDFQGVNIDGSFCIPPQYNVFFYFNPFVVDALPEWYAKYNEIQVYKTTTPLKIISLISPSELSRGTRMTKGKVIKSCNKTRKSCLVGRDYDACFNDKFLQKNPSIVGWIGIGRADSIKINKEIESGELQNVKEFIHLVKDKRNIEGPPELGLYPLKSRQLDDVKDADITADNYNYERIKSLPRNQEALVNFLNKNATHVKGKWYYSLNENFKI
jgi:hypothetical protein